MIDPRFVGQQEQQGIGPVGKLYNAGDMLGVIIIFIDGQ